MQLECQCPRCGQRFAVGVEWGGKSANCLTCGTPIPIQMPPTDSWQLPLPTELDLGAASPAPYYVPTYQSPNNSPSKSSQWLILAAIAVVGLFVLILVVVVVVSSRTSAVATNNVPGANLQNASGASPSLVRQDSSSTALPQPPTPPSAAPSPVGPNLVPPQPPAPLSPQDQIVQERMRAITKEMEKGPVTEWALGPPRKVLDASNDPSNRYTRRPSIEFGAAGCPIAIVNNRIWDIRQGKVGPAIANVSNLTGASISPNGKRMMRIAGSAVAVWDTSNGTRILNFANTEFKGGKQPLLSNDRIVIIGSDSVHVHNLNNGKKIHDFPATGAPSSSNHCALAPGGEYLAIFVSGKLEVYGITDGKRTVMDDPPRFPLFDPLRIALSPDGKHLAVTADKPERLDIWNQSGKFVRTIRLTALLDNEKYHRVHWFPDGMSILVGDEIYDIESGKMICEIKTYFRHQMIAGAFENRIVGTFGGNYDELSMRNIPWEQIRRSLAALKETADPKPPVATFEVEVNDKSGTSGSLKQQLEQLCARQLVLAKWGLGSSQTLHARFTITPGEKMAVFERKSTITPWVETNRTVNELNGQLTLELLVPNRKSPTWSHTVMIPSPRHFGQAVDQGVVKAYLMEQLVKQFFVISLPHYAPTDNDLIALPFTIE